MKKESTKVEEEEYQIRQTIYKRKKEITERGINTKKRKRIKKKSKNSRGKQK